MNENLQAILDLLADNKPASAAYATLGSGETVSTVLAHAKGVAGSIIKEYKALAIRIG